LLWLAYPLVRFVGAPGLGYVSAAGVSLIVADAGEAVVSHPSTGIEPGGNAGNTDRTVRKLDSYGYRENSVLRVVTT